MKNQNFYWYPGFSPINLNTFWEACRLAQTGFELCASAAATIGLRQQLWLTTPAWDPRLAIEWNRMVGEKIMAGFEVCSVLQRTAFDFWTGTAINPWISTNQMLMPLHRKTRANAHRLSRRK